MGFRKGLGRLKGIELMAVSLPNSPYNVLSGQPFYGKIDDAGVESGKLGRRGGAVIPLEQMTDEQFEQHALSVLHRELGVRSRALSSRLPC
jgi:hypothetical protein